MYNKATIMPKYEKSDFFLHVPSRMCACRRVPSRVCTCRRVSSRMCACRRVYLIFVSSSK